jgi:hypothetical protein
MYVLTTYSPSGDILAKYEFRTRDGAQYFADHYDLETPGLNLINEHVYYFADHYDLETPGLNLINEHVYSYTIERDKWSVE